MSMECPLIEIAQGKLTGCVRKDYNGEDFLEFLGVPYAKPPLGELRFKDPQPPEKWDGIRTCTTEYSSLYRDGSTVKGSEDCLCVNIYTKSVTPDQLKPVFVFIHGGSFIAGSNQTKDFGPEFIMTEDIVMVTVNYRLGLLGFLRLDDAELGVPGNAGLKDQSMALRWVQSNIEMFGGDPNQVTLGGESAGAASVHYQTLSPLSEGLFQRAILQSGCAICPFAVTDNNVIEILAAAGIDVRDENEAIDCVKNLPGEEVYQIQEKFVALKLSNIVVFGPVIEKPHPGAFITEHPRTLLESGKCQKIPMIQGYCNREGLLISVMEKFQAPEDPPVGAPIEVRIASVAKLDINDDFVVDWGRRIRELYLEGGDPDGEVLMRSDFLFIAPCFIAAVLQAKVSPAPVYLYEFCVDAGLNVMKKGANLCVAGACHGDDLGYQFKNSSASEIKEGSFEETSMKRFVRICTNFIKWGNPTPPGDELGVTWLPIQGDVVNYLEIADVLKPGVNPAPERMTLWKEFWESVKAYTNKV